MASAAGWFGPGEQLLAARAESHGPFGQISWGVGAGRKRSADQVSSSISNASSALLPRLAGHKAMRLVMESARIGARDGLAIGLLDEIVEQADLIQTASWARPAAPQSAGPEGCPASRSRQR
jgi:hypothetical protein